LFAELFAPSDHLERSPRALKTRHDTLNLFGVYKLCYLVTCQSEQYEN